MWGGKQKYKLIFYTEEGTLRTVASFSGTRTRGYSDVTVMSGQCEARTWSLIIHTCDVALAFLSFSVKSFNTSRNYESHSWALTWSLLPRRAAHRCCAMSFFAMSQAPCMGEFAVDFRTGWVLGVTPPKDVAKNVERLRAACVYLL